MKNKLVDEMTKDIEKRLKNALVYSSEAVHMEIERRFERIMGEEDRRERPYRSFYDSYIPYRYKRTHYSILASDGYNDYYKGYKIDMSKKCAVSGITVSSANIPGHPYRADTDWVFNRTFNYGIHGYTKAEADEWSSRPKNVEKGITFPYIDYPRSMKPLVPPPREQMDESFTKLKKENGRLRITGTSIKKEFIKGYMK